MIQFFLKTNMILNFVLFSFGQSQASQTQKFFECSELFLACNVQFTDAQSQALSENALETLKNSNLFEEDAYMPVNAHPDFANKRIDTTTNRPAIILNGSPAFEVFANKYLTAQEQLHYSSDWKTSEYLLVGNVLHGDRLYIAKIPVKKVKQLLFSYSNFMAIASHFMLQFNFDQDDQTSYIELIAEVPSNEKLNLSVLNEPLKSSIKLKEILLSIEATTILDGPDYDLYEAMDDKFVNAFKIVTLPTRILNHFRYSNPMQTFQTKFSSSQVEQILRLALSRSDEFRFKKIYHTILANCTNLALQVLMEATGLTFNETEGDLVHAMNLIVSMTTDENVTNEDLIKFLLEMLAKNYNVDLESIPAKQIKKIVKFKLLYELLKGHYQNEDLPLEIESWAQLLPENVGVEKLAQMTPDDLNDLILILPDNLEREFSTLLETNEWFTLKFLTSYPVLFKMLGANMHRFTDPVDGETSLAPEDDPAYENHYEFALLLAIESNSLSPRLLERSPKRFVGFMNELILEISTHLPDDVQSAEDLFKTTEGDQKEFREDVRTPLINHLKNRILIKSNFLTQINNPSLRPIGYQVNTEDFVQIFEDPWKQAKEDISRVLHNFGIAVTQTLAMERTEQVITQLSQSVKNSFSEGLGRLLQQLFNGENIDFQNVVNFTSGEMKKLFQELNDHVFESVLENDGEFSIVVFPEKNRFLSDFEGVTLIPVENSPKFLNYYMVNSSESLPPNVIESINQSITEIDDAIADESPLIVHPLGITIRFSRAGDEENMNFEMVIGMRAITKKLGQETNMVRLDNLVIPRNSHNSAMSLSWNYTAKTDSIDSLKIRFGKPEFNTIASIDDRPSELTWWKKALNWIKFWNSFISITTVDQQQLPHINGSINKYFEGSPVRFFIEGCDLDLINRKVENIDIRTGFSPWKEFRRQSKEGRGLFSWISWLVGAPSWGAGQASKLLGADVVNAEEIPDYHTSIRLSLISDEFKKEINKMLEVLFFSSE